MFFFRFFTYCCRIPLFLFMLQFICPAPVFTTEVTDTFKTRFEEISRFSNRTTGSDSAKKASQYIQDFFNSLQIGDMGIHRFQTPVKTAHESELTCLETGQSYLIHPLDGNLLTPEATPVNGLTGSFIYAGKGEMKDFNGKRVKGAFVFMDLDSGKNWINAADLGAAAVVYIKKGPARKQLYQDLFELTPVILPRFVIDHDQFLRIFNSDPSFSFLLKSRVHWELKESENVYLFIPGTDPELKKRMVVVESFFDTSSHILGLSPGADESISIATLLEIASYFKKHLPQRSVLLAATSGHGQNLSGLRSMVWALKVKGKELKKLKAEFSEEKESYEKKLQVLEAYISTGNKDLPADSMFVEAVAETIKNQVDRLNRQLIQMRLSRFSSNDPGAMKKLVNHLQTLRRLGWRTNFLQLDPDEQAAFAPIPEMALAEQKKLLKSAKIRIAAIKSDKAFRDKFSDFDMDAAISLHLSSNGNGFGGFSKGWLYPLKPDINRISPYSDVGSLLNDTAKNLDDGHLYKETLKPDLLKSFRNYFLDTPSFGGEVFALAGKLGFTLATINDGRFYWGTPDDIPDNVDLSYGARQCRLLSELVFQLTDVSTRYTPEDLRNGFSYIRGRARFLRQGELFADKAASGAVIAAYQGKSIFHTISDASGSFFIKGVADKKHVLDKVILEGLMFHPDSGHVYAAIDKELTGKDAYRIKMQRRSMECDLIMFAGKQSTLFHLTEPRNLNFLTKINVISAKSESEPLRYWYTRLDTRRSDTMSLFLESGTPFKLTLSDTVLKKKLVLTNGSQAKSIGNGYVVDAFPRLVNTRHQVAKDMLTLLEPRILQLETHGIFSQKIRQLFNSGKTSLEKAERSLKNLKYDQFASLSSDSWAFAQRVYDHVEKTKKDVLFGVLFYIALFVPFSFCAERLFFSFTDIHHRILCFLLILGSLILLIYHIHPAFHLAFSPGVVILAFFIMGLSLMVTLIIFFRFEREMTLMQRRAQNLKIQEISKWKAFVAAFFLGVSNLKRRKIRTGLTCATLIILTFTIMSFTTVKSIQGQNRFKLAPKAAYPGFLLKKSNWESLPGSAISTLNEKFEGKALTGPRIWLEHEGATEARTLPVSYNGQIFQARGAVGLSAREPEVTGIHKSLLFGKWFDEPDAMDVILSRSGAEQLGISLTDFKPVHVRIFGGLFRVSGIFNEKAFEQITDLDQEPMTPVIFPQETNLELTEVEQEAMEAGDNVLSAQTRYFHLPAGVTLVFPYQTLISLGGTVKGVALRTSPDISVKSATQQMVDRFALLLFSGEKTGAYVYEASESIQFSGVPNIAIPIFISVLIVLNTMISSVYERKREIGIYTSMGLAPSHVGFLFVAEALAFSILSVITGYLIAQTSARFLSTTSLWDGITVNYSSLAGVGAMVLVMAVVLVSVVYPAKVAAHIAIPDVNRSWKMPRAINEQMDVVLPFLMKYTEFYGIGAFLHEHFKSHENISHGLFSTDNVHFSHLSFEDVKDAEGDFQNSKSSKTELTAMNACLWLSATVWLAPFDFGVMQKADLYFCPAEKEPGFLEIKIRIKRLAGEANMWKRINKAFLLDIRKQILVWRSLETADNSVS